MSDHYELNFSGDLTFSEPGGRWFCYRCAANGTDDDFAESGHELVGWPPVPVCNNEAPSFS